MPMVGSSEFRAGPPALRLQGGIHPVERCDFGIVAFGYDG